MIELNEENMNLLKRAFIPEEYWEHCYIVDGVIYTPMYNKEGVLLTTGKEMYDKVSQSNQSQSNKSIEQKMSELALEVVKSNINSANLESRISKLENPAEAV